MDFFEISAIKEPSSAAFVLKQHYDGSSPIYHMV